MVLWSPIRLSGTNTPKRCFFHYEGLECKSRKSRNAWSNTQIWTWSTKQSREKANRVLLRERTDNSKHSLPTTQKKTLHMDITRWSMPKSDWLYSLQPKMEKLYYRSIQLLYRSSIQKLLYRNSIQSSKTRPAADWLRSWTPYSQVQTYIEESRENH